MATVIPAGEPANDDERRVIAFLRDNLPSGYLILHNFEIRHHGQTFEVDLAIIAPHCVYLVDVKGTRGPIDVHGSRWYPAGRAAFASPLLKLRQHARVLKSIITDSQPGRGELNSIYVDAIVILSARDAVLRDHGNRDAPSVVKLDRSAVRLKNAALIPAGRSRNITALHSIVLSAIQGSSRPRTGPLRFGNWEVTERLGGAASHTDYRAVNSFAGAHTSPVLLRVYAADPYLPETQRNDQRNRIARAFDALSAMPGHPGIVGVRDFFPTDGEDRYVLVTEDLAGDTLRAHIDKPALALTVDQKLRVARDLLAALAHAHSYGVIHRNLSPGVVVLGADGQVRLTGFEFARVGENREHTIAHQIVDDLDPQYQAPEVYREPANANGASDVFSAGLILYELLTGDRPFASPTEVFDHGAVFPVPPSQVRSELPPSLDTWLQRLCAFDPDARPTAADAADQLASLLASEDDAGARARVPTAVSQAPAPTVDYERLPPGFLLAQKYRVEKRLGKGSFGVVYRVIDTLGDVARAVKVITADRHSVLDRLKQEYRTLVHLPEHPNVVRVYDAQFAESGDPPPFIVFEHVDGLDVDDMVASRLFSAEDALDLARQVTDGLVHLHHNDVFHCDIKPRNLLWTSRGVRIIDFNVSVLAATSLEMGGGSRRYLPPDLDLDAVPHRGDLADRDLYALGITLYQVIAARYPWESQTPPPGTIAPDLRDLPGLEDLSVGFAHIVHQLIAPKRADRFATADDVQAALKMVTSARRPADKSVSVASLEPVSVPNTNPHVSRLLTFYSQSTRTNAGTRGLDKDSKPTYVETMLDRALEPAVLGGQFRLVVITGNAGDGKTAFLQRLEERAREHQAVIEELLNGRRFTLRGRTFVTNYDGSQDEGETASDDVLGAFFAPFAGADAQEWPADETRLIAINEGRLVDFLDGNEGRFALLRHLVGRGLAGAALEHGVAVVNLNLRSVVQDALGYLGEDGDGDESIFARAVRRLTDPALWAPCADCDIRTRCYAYHNARTFQDAIAGPKVLARLKTIYTLTHLRGRMHITLRDMRSALAYMLVGTRDCAEIHRLYESGDREAIAQGFYFNSWHGGDAPSSDRLLTLLKDMDMGLASDPRLDRTIGFLPPPEDRGLFRFDERDDYDLHILQGLFTDLPRDYSGKTSAERAKAHAQYVAMARRRAFFERRDGGWLSMIPYQSADRMLRIVSGREDLRGLLTDTLRAVNRSEGLHDAGQLDGSLALQVRQVERGTIRSYRLFPADRFRFEILDPAANAQFVEHMPAGLVLRYRSGHGSDATLVIHLDVFEMLQRLNEGYRPNIEEEQGYYLGLVVFKNRLSSEPYQEVLLTTTGHDFFRVRRHPDGRLELSELGTVDAGGA